MAIKKGDFIEIDFVGRIKDSGAIFDLTKKDVAEKEKISNKSADYSPRIVCVGNQDVVKGLDDYFIGKEAGKKYQLDIDVDEAFGRKDPKLIKMMPLNTFKKQNMKPFPGLQVNIDGNYGTIRTVSGGRVLVDFNHPLSGKEVSYDLEIKRIVTKDSEKVSGVLKGLVSKDVKCEVKAGIAKIDLDLPKEFQKILSDRITQLVKTVKKVEFVKHTPEKNTSKQK
jgi:FKBP-type peptidyl-prolyl cis-trans isomerase SlyD